MSDDTNDHAAWSAETIARARDLLAVIHCDGGHHAANVGFDAAITDAIAQVYELRARVTSLTAECEGLATQLEAEIEAHAATRADAKRANDEAREVTRERDEARIEVCELLSAPSEANPDGAWPRQQAIWRGWSYLFGEHDGE